MADKSFMEDFRSPGKEFRAKPLWAWNGKLDPHELRWQIRVMKRMGLGGFFMHSRVGMDTPYLSDEWFNCIKACLDEARKCDMEAWLYDEDRWPSGAAGGLVTKNPDNRMRALELETHQAGRFEWDEEMLAVFVARIRGHEAFEVARVAKGEKPKPAKGQSVLVFRVCLAPLSNWFNGYSYLDTMSETAVLAFLETTHLEYHKRFHESFGNVIPGIFTDEPHHGGKFLSLQDTNSGRALPWTKLLPETFRNRYGYDILDHLPELFFDVDAQPITPARHNYHDCTTFMFTNASGRIVGEWCARNNLLYTGHVIHEKTLSDQTACVGSCMRYYEFMQAPGMDLLTEFCREFDTAKQVASAARQFGRKWRLTETYGCTGWDFPFVAHKTIGDWQLALGINLRCPHLSWYTMEGEAKRDYPASILHQSPWWESYNLVEDYFARIHAVMTRGQEIRDLLVVHPVESMWMLCRKDWLESTSVKHYDRMLKDLRDSLLAGNIDFDYGDEDIMARHGRVETTGGRAELVVGQARYRGVVVPPLMTMRGTTLDLLEAFRAAGGEVVFAGKPANYVDAVASLRAVNFAATCSKAPASGEPLVQAVEPTCRRLSIADANGNEIPQAMFLLREDDQNVYLFVCNVSYDFRKRDDKTWVKDRTDAFDDVRISGFTGCKGAPIELDASSGEAFVAQANRKAGGWEIRTSLRKAGSRLFVVPKQSSRSKLQKRKSDTPISIRKISPESWDYCMSDCNNLVLDRPAFRLGEGKQQSPVEILRIDRAARKNLGLTPRGGEMVQPWARQRQANSRRLPVELNYRFDVKTLPSGGLFIGMERPDLFSITINGTDICTLADAGWWTDKSLRKIPVDPTIFRIGRNEIVLKCDYDEDHPGLEAVYLLGHFGVKVCGTDVCMTALPKNLTIGDWVKQGLAFYSGSVSYLTTISPKVARGQRVFVRVPGYKGVAVRVLVEGRLAGTAGWEPNEVEITHLLKGGKERIAIEVLGHRRNSHGPLHLADAMPIAIGPFSYVTSGKRWTDKYQLVECGLTEAPQLVVK